jgi:hypothetical protein
LIAQTAKAAADAQETILPGEELLAQLVMRMAVRIRRINEESTEIEERIQVAVDAHDDGASLVTVPGFGPNVIAEFLGAIASNPAVRTSPNRMAGLAGLAPVPRDSGIISGDLHRPRHYDFSSPRIHVCAQFATPFQGVVPPGRPRVACLRVARVALGATSRSELRMPSVGSC